MIDNPSNEHKGASAVSHSAAGNGKVVDRIVEHIRGRLSSGKLLQGDRLPSERQLALDLGVGRNAVRESLRVLKASGVITIRKGHTGGAFVSQGDANATADGLADLLRLRGGRVTEIDEVRRWFSEVCIRAACERRTPGDIERLRDNLNKVAGKTASHLLPDRLDASAQFHVLLAMCSQNSLLVLMAETIMGITAQFAREHGIEASEFCLNDRRRIVDAIERRELSAATAAMENHLRTVHSRLDSAESQ